METAEAASRLRALGTPDIVDALLKLGISRVVMNGPRLLAGAGGTRVGRARTLRLVPHREDVESGPQGAVNRKLYDAMMPGEMLVVDALGITDKAALGD